MELYRIPDAAYDLKVRYSQWPDSLSDETDELPYDDLDTQTVFLSKDIANAYFSGDYLDFASKARDYVKIGKVQATREPNHRLKAHGFYSTAGQELHGEYWNDPSVRRTI